MILGIAGLAGSGKDTVADHLVENHGFVKVSLADPLKRICREVFDFSEEQLWGPSEERNKPDNRYPRTYDFGGVVVRGGAGPTRIQDGDKETTVVEGIDFFLTPRHALQQLGTEWGRSCYENVWVDYALRVAFALLKGAATQATKYEAPTYECMEHPEYDPRVGLGAWRVRAEASIAKGVVIPDVRFKNEVEAIKAAGGMVIQIIRPGAGLQGEAGQHVSETELEGYAFQGVLYNDGTLPELERSSSALYNELKNWAT